MASSITHNILLTGVGGQGIITASQTLAEACLLSGFQVKKSEIHGMSQRGGSVESHVRFCTDGEVHSPTIPEGEADVLISFELLEALRGLAFTRPTAQVIADERRIIPMSVTAGKATYPADPEGLLRASGREVHIVRAFEVAARLGEPRAANIVLLGVAARFLPIAAEVWTEAIRAVVRPKAVDINIRALEAGRGLVA
jgi:indolepyruvate ferredoxin oxidoreductase, beta subunit